MTQPERIGSPIPASRGALSPVRATVFKEVAPSITVPSIGTFSPGFTTMISPTDTSSGLTVTTFPSRSTFAVSGRMSRSWEIARWLLPSAMPSNSSPTWKKSMTNTASANIGLPPGTKPMSRAPTVAMHMRKSSFRASPWARPSPASFKTSNPAAK